MSNTKLKTLPWSKAVDAFGDNAPSFSKLEPDKPETIEFDSDDGTFVVTVRWNPKPKKWRHRVTLYVEYEDNDKISDDVHNWDWAAAVNEYKGLSGDPIDISVEEAEEVDIDD